MAFDCFYCQKLAWCLEGIASAQVAAVGYCRPPHCVQHLLVCMQSYCVGAATAAAAAATAAAVPAVHRLQANVERCFDEHQWQLATIGCGWLDFLWAVQVRQQNVSVHSL